MTDYYETREWRGLRRKCLRRDKNACRRCKVKFKYGRYLTAHHIIPRPDGIDDLSNLIALCTPCHDLIEGLGYRTIGEIVTIDTRQIKDDRLVDATDWQMWVYGGYRNPANETNLELEQHESTNQTSFTWEPLGIEIIPLPTEKEMEQRQKEIDMAYEEHILFPKRKLTITPKPKVKQKVKPLRELDPSTTLPTAQIAYYLRVSENEAEHFVRYEKWAVSPGMEWTVTVKSLNRRIKQLSYVDALSQDTIMYQPENEKEERAQRDCEWCYHNQRQGQGTCPFESLSKMPPCRMKAQGFFVSLERTSRCTPGTSHGKITWLPQNV